MLLYSFCTVCQITVVSVFCVRISVFVVLLYIFFFKQKTAYEMRISDWSSDVCSSDLLVGFLALGHMARRARPAAIQFTLDIVFIQGHPGRTTVNHRADGRAVGFAKIRDAKKFA